MAVSIATLVKHILPLLEQEWEDSGTMAKALITAIDEKRADDKHWVVQYQGGEWEDAEVPKATGYSGRPVFLTYGPFVTEKQAATFMAKLLAMAPSKKQAAVIVPITRPSDL